MKITDKEVIDAMKFIKSQHNGELPYKFGTFECAKMMAKYLIENQTEILFCQGCHNWKSIDDIPDDYQCSDCREDTD